MYLLATSVLWVEKARRSQEIVVMKNLIKYSNECDDEYFTVRVGKLSILDVLAKEFKYHRSGYRTITRPSLRKAPNKCLERDLRETSF